MESTLVPARKGKGIDDLLSTLTPGTVEEIRRISITPHPIAPLLQKYEWVARQCANEANNVWPPNILHQVYSFIHDQVREVLNPSDIDLFLQASLPYAEHPYYPHTMGAFINRLLLNATQNGYNSFDLHTQSCGPLNFVGKDLCGSAPWRIQLTVEGDLGIESGTWMEYVDFGVSGTVNLGLGSNSKHCRFLFLDILDEREGRPCRHNYSRLLASSGIQAIYNGREAEDCTFVVRTKGCAEMLAESLPPGNKVVYRTEDKDFILRGFEHEPTQ